MWVRIGLGLLVLWIAYHVVAWVFHMLINGLIHLLILGAIIAIVLHFLQGGRKQTL